MKKNFLNVAAFAFLLLAVGCNGSSQKKQVAEAPQQEEVVGGSVWYV